MQEPSIKNDGAEMDELEPLILAAVTEVTGEEDVPGHGDWRNIVWGNED